VPNSTHQLRRTSPMDSTLFPNLWVGSESAHVAVEGEKGVPRISLMRGIENLVSWAPVASTSVLRHRSASMQLGARAASFEATISHTA
jgi:hypothetical protein